MPGVGGPDDKTLRPEEVLGSAMGSDEETVASEPAAGPGAGRLPRGTAVGRYVVLHELGAGAMGRVYSAYDPRLDRRIALKVLRFDRDQGELYRRAERRLLREAQALAKLSHPHVVAVHDVESVEGSLVVAMDFIAGQTLRRWLQAEPRAWPEVVRVLAQAGEGLAAAHRSGLVHRDFKPDNVMLDAEGRAHVVDFGLAQAFALDTASEEVSPWETGDPEAPSPAPLFTRTRGMAGTPAYMAPEQHIGEGVGPASDQFALCVTLYEGLYGRRPFEGATLLSLSTSVLAGEIVPPPRNSPVPAPIRDAVLRGLATDPQERHPDLEALLAALRYDPAARRRRRLTAVAGVGLLAAASAGALGFRPEPAPRPCTGGVTKLEGVWDRARREAAERALLATGRAYVSHGWERARAQLDRYAEGWSTMHDEACAATRLRGEQSERLLDLRMACLQRHRRQLAATGALLAEADAEVAEGLTRLVAGLPALSRCADADALLAAVPPPHDLELRAEVEQVGVALARARALERSGKYEPALAVARAAVDRTAPLGYGPAHAEALLLRGFLEDKVGDSSAAEDTLSAAAWLAQRSRHDEVAARAMTELTFVVGSELSRTDEGLQWARHADAAVGRVGDAEAQARLLNNRAAVLVTAGRYHEASDALRRALALRERVLPVDHPDIASTRVNLGIALDELGHGQEALSVYRVALDERTRALGPEHPRVAALLINMAQLLAGLGQLEEAMQVAERSIVVCRAALGEAHPYLASAYNNLATVHVAREEYDAAFEALEQSLVIWEELRPPGHPDLGDAHFNVGAVLSMVDRDTEARPYLERALEIWAGAHGPDHPDVAKALLNLGIIDRYAGEDERARQRLSRALEIMRGTVADDHLDLGRSYTELSRVYLALERFGEAEQAAAQSQRVHRSRADEPWRRLEARYLRARAQWARGEDRPAALVAARAARDAMDDPELRAEIEAWLQQVEAENR